MTALILSLLLSVSPECAPASWKTVDDGRRVEGMCCWWPDGSTACAVEGHEDDGPPSRQESPPDPRPESGEADA